MKKILLPFLASVFLFTACESSSSEKKSNVEDDITFVSQVELKKILEEGEIAVYDVRSPELHAMGHIPGTENLYSGALQQNIQSFLEEHPKDEAMVFYCAGYSCGASTSVAKYLLHLGYQEIMVYPAGFEEWLASDNPIGKSK